MGVAILRLMDVLEDQECWKSVEVRKLMSHLESRKRDNDFKDMEACVQQLLPAVGGKWSKEELLEIAGIMILTSRFYVDLHSLPKII